MVSPLYGAMLMQGFPKDISKVHYFFLIYINDLPDSLSSMLNYFLMILLYSQLYMIETHITYKHIELNSCKVNRFTVLIKLNKNNLIDWCDTKKYGIKKFK